MTKDPIKLLNKTLNEVIKEFDLKRIDSRIAGKIKTQARERLLEVMDDVLYIVQILERYTVQEDRYVERSSKISRTSHYKESVQEWGAPTTPLEELAAPAIPDKKEVERYHKAQARVADVINRRGLYSTNQVIVAALLKLYFDPRYHSLTQP